MSAATVTEVPADIDMAACFIRLTRMHDGSPELGAVWIDGGGKEHRVNFAANR